MTSYPLFQNIFTSKRSRVAIFAEVIKSVTMFIKTILKESKKLKELEIQSISVVLDIAKFADLW